MFRGRQKIVKIHYCYMIWCDFKHARSTMLARVAAGRPGDSPARRKRSAATARKCPVNAAGSVTDAGAPKQAWTRFAKTDASPDAETGKVS